jgi:hypothetical protein
VKEGSMSRVLYLQVLVLLLVLLAALLKVLKAWLRVHLIPVVLGAPHMLLLLTVTRPHQARSVAQL